MQRILVLLCNLLVIVSYPAYAASPLGDFAAANDLEFIVAGCLTMGIFGTVGGMLYPMPVESKIHDWRLKLIASLMAGFAAFVYAVGDAEGLRPITALWVGGVALVAPAMLDNGHALVISLISKRIGGA